MQGAHPIFSTGLSCILLSHPLWLPPWRHHNLCLYIQYILKTYLFCPSFSWFVTVKRLKCFALFALNFVYVLMYLLLAQITDILHLNLNKFSWKKFSQNPRKLSILNFLTFVYWHCGFYASWILGKRASGNGCGKEREWKLRGKGEEWRKSKV